MTRTIGIISDTHRSNCNEGFRSKLELAFGNCDVLVHAGDITEMSVLDAFTGWELIAVHGNMCSQSVQAYLPESRVFSLDTFSFALCHGAGLSGSIEECLFERFPDVDCIIYGHTHHPVTVYRGAVLFINPGSFAGTGRYGSAGTYAILKTSETGIAAEIHSLPQ